MRLLWTEAPLVICQRRLPRNRWFFLQKNDNTQKNAFKFDQLIMYVEVTSGEVILHVV